MANVSDPEIAQAYEDVRNDATGYNWFVLGYANNNTIKVDGKGSGGVSEGVSYFKDNEVQYGLFKVSFVANDDTKRTKFVFVSWSGEQASVLRRGKMSVHKASVKSIIKDFAVEVATSSHEDLTEEGFVERIKAINY